MIMRMDLNFNEEVLVKQLQSCPCSIITNRPLNDFIINNYHKQIVELVYYITDDHDPEFIKKAKSKSITFLLRTRKDQQSIPDLKLDYFDFGMIQPEVIFLRVFLDYLVKFLNYFIMYMRKYVVKFKNNY